MTKTKVFELTPPVNKRAGKSNAETDKPSAPAQTELRRTPWNGGVRKEELERPGGTLLGMLTQRANELGHNLALMADALGCTYGYISQLRTGARRVTTIRDSFVDACANYLGVPRMTVLLASGKVQPTDIYEDPHEVMQSVPNALQFMKSDAQWGPLMPVDVMSYDLKAQFFIVKLYEAATDRKLLKGASMNPEDVAYQIEKIEEYRTKLRERVAAAQEAGLVEDAEEA